jgi:threonine dehydrogenase-like Zn-dependent dehydrogenase
LARAEKARAVYFESPRTVTIRQEEVLRRTDEVLITSELIGISHGTELLFYRGPFPRGQLLENRNSVGSADGYPIKYGYMNVGLADDGGRVFAFYPHQDRFAAAADALVPVPDGIGSEDAVFYPSVETAVQIVHDAAPALGERILVCGLGVIGLTVSHLLRRMGLEVVAADPIAARRERARRIGCSTVDPADPEVDREIADRSEARGVDIAINTSSNARALQLAIRNVEREGTIVEASWYGEHTVRLDLGAHFHRNRVTIRSSQVSHLNPAMEPRWTRERRSALAWQLIREIEPHRFITHRFPLDEAARAYDVIVSRPEEVLQVVLVP